MELLKAQVQLGMILTEEEGEFQCRTVIQDMVMVTELVVKEEEQLEKEDL
jgi:hypothetical protein